MMTSPVVEREVLGVGRREVELVNVWTVHGLRHLVHVVLRVGVVCAVGRGRGGTLHKRATARRRVQWLVPVRWLFVTVFVIFFSRKALSHQERNHNETQQERPHKRPQNGRHQLQQCVQVLVTVSRCLLIAMRKVYVIISDVIRRS